MSEYQQNLEDSVLEKAQRLEELGWKEYLKQDMKPWALAVNYVEIL